MKLKRQLTWTILFVIAVTVTESSILKRLSLLHPQGQEPCFTCRAEDRPFAYPLIAYLGKVKDMFVRGLNVLVASTKDYKLDSKLDKL